jgi:ribosomal 50S subunit-recycling heat shock protein
MRLDKFLAVVHLAGSRVAAQELCRLGRVEVNGLQAKPSRDIREGDLIRITFHRRAVTAQVREIPGRSVPRRERERFYSLLAEEILPG